MQTAPQQSEPASKPAEVAEFKVKTLEEIRAEKLAKVAKSLSPSQKEAPAVSPPPAAKRTAQANNRHIKIKRPKLSSDNSPSPTVQVKSTAPTANKKVEQVEDSLSVEDDYLEEEDDDTGTADAGAINDDELFLEIDNILGH